MKSLYQGFLLALEALSACSMALLLLGCAMVAAVSVGGSEQRLFERQRILWASAASSSSEYSSSSWSAWQATRAPDTAGCGDMTTAWATKSPDVAGEWLELVYPEAVFARGIRVIETYNPGAVAAVEVKTSRGAYQGVWSGFDPTTACPGIFDIEFNQPVETNTVRIRLRSESVSGWNEIDAVGLVVADAPRQTGTTGTGTGSGS